MKKQIKLIISVLLIITTITACSKSNKTGNKADNKANTNSTMATNTETTNNQDNTNTNDQQVGNQEESGKSEQEDTINKALPDGVEQLFQVKFTAKTKATSQDITKYYSSMESETKVTKAKTIPDGVTKLLIDNVNLQDGESKIDAMLTKEEISVEDFTKLTGTEVYEGGSISAIQVDGDNDGKGDIIALNYGGGTAGICDLEFYKGNGDDTYTLTNTYNCVLTSFGVISDEGKNYIVLRDFDYNTKNFSGYILLLYEDGKLSDGKTISLEVEDYDMNILQEEDSFAGIEEVKKTLCNKSYPSILEKSNYVIYGNAEKQDKEAKYEYSCDINNDGNDEFYNKTMFFPSNLGTSMICEYEFDTSKNLEGINELLTQENETLYSFWCDKVVDKNVLYVYFGDDKDYTLYAYLIQR